MPIPTWSVGEVLAASDVNNWFVPVAASKAGDTSRASTTTLTADPDLQFPVAANAKYYFSATFFYAGGTQGSSDFKIGWTFPSGLTMTIRKTGLDTTGAITVGVLSVQTDQPTFGTAIAAGTRTADMSGTVYAGSTAGSLALTWCQGTSNATPTVLKTGSAMILTRIG